MLKFLSIMFFALLLSGNKLMADNLMSILGVNLKDSINKYTIIKDHGPDLKAKTIRSYSVLAEIKNKYFDSSLEIKTYGPQQKIYKIRAIHNKQIGAITCESLLVSIFDKKKSQFINNEYQLEYRTKATNNIEALFSKIDDSVLFIGTCRKPVKNDFDTPARIFIEFRDNSLERVFLKEYEEFYEKEEIEKLKGF